MKWTTFGRSGSKGTGTKPPEGNLGAPVARHVHSSGPAASDSHGEDFVIATSPDEALAEMLRIGGHADRSAIAQAVAHHRETGASLVQTMVSMGVVSDTVLAGKLSELLGLPLALERDFPIVPVAEQQLGIKFLKASKVLPLRETDAELHLAVVDPFDDYVVQAVALSTGKRVVMQIAGAAQIERALGRIYESARDPDPAPLATDLDSDEDDGSDDINRLRDLASETPVVRMVNALINHAVDTRASDIHVEPYRNRLRVRYRIDGVLHDVDSAPARSAAAVISRLKIMAKLDIAERRRPQDGRIQLRVQGKEIDLRVSTVPSLHGESVVMRILDREHVALDFDSLGFSDDITQRFVQTLELPHGIILVTGPTGSGKTTTLYAALQHLNTASRKIITVEDPVEYQLDGITQMQVKPQIDLSFATALRSIVRQDPDVIMVGEMRDLETASIAIQAALTGHLVLSTLHTNDAGGSITRLIDMGAEPFLLTSSVNAILAQRLLRRLCPACRRATPASDAVLRALGIDQASLTGAAQQLYSPVGCDECGRTGYRGRTVVTEFLAMNDELRKLILARADGTEIQRVAVECGMLSMKQDGLRKALAGLTSVEEVLRVTQDV